jgi:hypothetical protein
VKSHILLRIFLFVASLLAISCGSQPTDPRSVIPADALVYLETSDLGTTLSAITDNPNFQRLAKSKPDLSALSGVKLSVAVTGFETSEQTVTEENSLLKFRPRFVAVAETNAWGWQTTRFVENKLGEFINDVYGGEIELEVTPRNDGRYYVWTAQDGRKAYALQQGSLVFFGNDDSAIDQCQAVKRGEAESIAKSGKVAEGERLAFGYVSPEGVGQIANIAGMALALGASEEDEVKSFVARVLPEILRNSVRDITWTATRNESGVQDRIVATLDDESSSVFNETIVPAEQSALEVTSFVPETAVSATRYLLRDPQIAWRSVVFTARKKTDETSGALIAGFSSSLFEPYGVEDPEVFLSATGPQLLTVRLTPDNEDVAVVAAVKDVVKVKHSLAHEIIFTKPAENYSGADLWRSEDGELAAGFVGNFVAVGDAETVLKCLEAKASSPDSELRKLLVSSDAVSVTVGRVDPPLKIVGLFSETQEAPADAPIVYRTETRFNNKGIERRTFSDFGLLGSVLEHLADE